MRTIKLRDIAHGRSGDKGDTVNVGVIAWEAEDYPLICRAVTPHAVKRHLGDLIDGEVECHMLPQIHALNIVLRNALDGGGTVNLRLDAQGKLLCEAVLSMELHADDDRGVRS